MFDTHISRRGSIVDKKIINYMRNHFAFMIQMLLKSNRIQMQKIHIIRYEHDNIDDNNNDNDINDENERVIKNTNIARTLT